MKHLSRLSPAETLVLTRGSAAKLKDELKVTLMDLFLKEVLESAEVSNGSGKPADMYVKRGRRFESYKPLAHEEVYLSIFGKDANARVLFKNCVRIGYEKAANEKKYAKAITKNPALRDCFASGIMRMFLGPFALTPAGKSIALEVVRELKESEAALAKAIDDDKAAALAVMKTIGGNIFLLGGIDFAMLRDIEKQLATESTARQSRGLSSFPDTATWLALDTHYHSSGDSGCSGCSGCSGGD